MNKLAEMIMEDAKSLSKIELKAQILVSEREYDVQQIKMYKKLFRLKKDYIEEAYLYGRLSMLKDLEKHLTYE